MHAPLSPHPSISCLLSACDGKSILCHDWFESTERMQAFQESTTHCGFLALSRREFRYNLVESLSEREFISKMVGQRVGYSTEKTAHCSGMYFLY